MRISDHKVLITGGSGGIGLALATAFIDAGSRVVICGRNEAKLAEAKAKLPALEILVCDLSDAQAVSNLPTRAEALLGGLSILINNAGIQHNFSFVEEPPELAISKSCDEIQTNLIALIGMTAASLPILKRTPGAAIINVSSGLAFTPKADAAVYCATKAAVHSFTQALRYQVEDSKTPIHIIEVMPPLVATDMTTGRQDGAITATDVASAVISGLRNDNLEIQVGKVRLLSALMRLAPSLAARILRNS